MKGCQYREHTVHADCDRDRAILSLVNLAEVGGCLYDVAPTRVSSSINDPWWNGITLGIRKKNIEVNSRSDFSYFSSVSREARSATKSKY